MSDDKLVNVFAGEFWQASVIKQLLDDSSIPAELNNQYLSTVAPYISSPGGTPNVTVVISDTQLTEAQQLVNEYLNSPDIDD